MNKICKKLTAVGLSALMSLALPFTASAAWKQNEQKQWSWSENGVTATGWQMINSKWYHFSSSGIMDTGWIKDGDTWYLLSQNGDMRTGWVKEGGKWYYLEPSGAMLADTVTPDGLRVDKNGVWVQKTPVPVAKDEKGQEKIQQGLLDAIDAADYLFSASDLLINADEDDVEAFWKSVDDAKGYLNKAMPLMLKVYDTYACYTETADAAKEMALSIQLIRQMQQILAPLNRDSSESDWLRASVRLAQVFDSLDDLSHETP